MLDQKTAGPNMSGGLPPGEDSAGGGGDGRRLPPVLVGVAIACVLLAAGAVVVGRVWNPFDDSPPPPPPPVSLALSPADGAADVRLDAAVDVTATLGQLEKVSVTAASGAATAGDYSTEPGFDPAAGP